MLVEKVTELAITQYEVPDDIVDAKSQNVRDLYKGWLASEVRAELDKNRLPVVSIFMNLTHDFNKSSAIRSNNAFLGKEVYIVGNRRYDRRGTVGTHRYQTIFHADSLQEVVEKLRKNSYTIFAVDNIMEYGPENVWDIDFPERSAFLYGEEQLGLSKEYIDLCDGMIYVETPGSVRSLNVSATASVILAEYSRRFRHLRNC